LGKFVEETAMSKNCDLFLREFNSLSIRNNLRRTSNIGMRNIRTRLHRQKQTTERQLLQGDATYLPICRLEIKWQLAVELT